MRYMIGQLLTLVIAAGALGCARGPAAVSPTASASQFVATPEQRATAHRAIAATLAHGARAWNAGALEEFLSDYVPDATTTFVTKTAVLHGLPAIRGVYAARFAPGATRDSLHFEALEVDLLAPDVANAIAYYVLMHGDSVTSRGPTSLVMRHLGGRWRIAHDHSS